MSIFDVFMVRFCHNFKQMTEILAIKVGNQLLEQVIDWDTEEMGRFGEQADKDIHKYMNWLFCILLFVHLSLFVRLLTVWFQEDVSLQILFYYQQFIKNLDLFRVNQSVKTEGYQKVQKANSEFVFLLFCAFNFDPDLFDRFFNLCGCLSQF